MALKNKISISIKKKDGLFCVEHPKERIERIERIERKKLEKLEKRKKLKKRFLASLERKHHNEWKRYYEAQVHEKAERDARDAAEKKAAAKDMIYRRANAIAEITLDLEDEEEVSKIQIRRELDKVGAFSIENIRAIAAELDKKGVTVI